MDYTKYLDKSGNGSKAKLDLYRAILYVGYQFTDDIKFVSEIEWEHGGREKTGGYGIMEQAYLDFRLNNAASLKLGHVIVPVGMVNLYHEPTSFYSVARPEVEKYIIPSTWHENAAILHGKVSNFDYQVGILAGLNADNSYKIRSMRQHGQKSKADDFAAVARVDYKSNVGVNVGASVFTGKAGQGNAALSDVSTTIAEIHAGYNMHSIHLNGLYAQNTVKNASAVAVDHNHTATEKGSGFYVTAAYDVTDKWTPFVQYEKYNTNAEQVDNTGASIAAAKDVVNTTIGVNYFPTKNVVLKAAYMMRDNKGTDDNQFHLGTGYVF